MALNTLLIAAAGISAAADSAAFDDIGMTHEIGAIPRLESVIYSPSVQRDARTSAHFRSARVPAVLDWLQSHGFSFAVNDGDISSAKTITLNISNQPISAIADAVAATLGGHWEQTAGIHIFKKGSNSFFTTTVIQPSFAWGDGAPMTSMTFDKDVVKLFAPDGFKSQSEAVSPELKKKLMEQFGPEFQKKMQEQFGPEFQKQFKDAFGSDFQKQMKDQFGSKFQKELQNQFGESFQKTIPKASSPDFEKKMKDQFGPEFEKKMQGQFGEKFQKQMEDQFGPKFEKKMQDAFGPEFEKKMQDSFGPKFQKQMEEMAKQLEKSAESNKWMIKGFQSPGQSFGTPLMAPSRQSPWNSSTTFANGKLDPIKLLESLTPAQKDEQRKQGFVWFNDLTREQKLMFEEMHGTFDFQVKINGEELRVRSN